MSWERALRELSDPKVPSSATADVMARIRAADDARKARPAAARARRGFAVWRVLTGGAGMVGTLVAYVTRLLDGSEVAGVLVPTTAGWLDRGLGWLDGGPLAVVMLIGLICYAVSLAGSIFQRDTNG